MFLIDNSSRMKIKDSHIGRSSAGSTNRRDAAATGNGHHKIERIDNVSRWEELHECVAFHAKMASKCWIPTKYCLVNDPASSSVERKAWQKHHGRKFHLCWGSVKDVPSELNVVKHAMTNATLDQHSCMLSSCIHRLSKGIVKEGPSLSARNAHVTLVICTQGLPTDEDGRSGSDIRREFQKEMSRFAGLPVKVIVRLCTDNEKVRDMFNTMDGHFDSIDVLDDFWGEALEVYLHNPWLTYSMGLHRLRESGLAPRVIDDLDERPLSLDEIHQMCKMLFLGEDGRIDLPHPRKNWDNFFRALKILVEKEKPQWNSIKKGMTPWINLSKLEAMHGGGESSRYHRNHNHHGRHGDHHPRRNRHSNPGQTSSRPREDDRSRHRHRTKYAGHDSDRSRERGSSSPQDPTRERHRSNQNSSRDQHRREHGPAHRRTHSREPQSRKESHGARVAQHAERDNSALALPEVLERWSRRPPEFETLHSLQHILVTVPQTFPPTNTKVEPHEYFAKWKAFDKEAFSDEGDDELKELLKRAVRKAKFFLHPDKLPKDLTENQTLLFKTIWNVIQDQEAATLG